VAKLQAASVPIAQAAALWDTDGRITLFQNAPYGGGIIMVLGMNEFMKAVLV